MDITKRTTAYYPTSHNTGVAVVADPESGGLDIMDLWASNGGDGYWFDVTTNPGTTGRQVCDHFYSTGSTLHGISAPKRTANRIYKTRRGLDAFIVAAKAAGCQTAAEQAKEMAEFWASPEGRA